jgi:lysophospholipase L1-like esterase
MHRPTLKTALLALVLAASTAAAAFAQVDFTRYVAIGDSLTAGFMSGGLVQSAQVNSYPALIHRQATGSDTGFQQPLVSAPGIPPLVQLVSLSPLVLTRLPGQGQPINLNVPQPYNNLGIPGATLADILNTKSGGIFDLILRNPAFQNTTALQQALALHPTFVTVWIGNNDALNAATSGIVNDQTLTPAATFDVEYKTLLGAIAQNSSAKMAVALIPDVTTIPFVTTIPPVAVNPATQKPVLVGGNPVFLIGPHGQLGPGDHVLLSAAGLLAQGIGIPAALGGTGQPLPDQVVLDAQETATITARIAAYNASIRAAANTVNAAVVDTNALLHELATSGIDVGGIEFTSAFLTGGVFSYDGIHPTAFGYAFVANAFIDSINAKFGSSIPPVDYYNYIFGPAVIAAPAVSPEIAAAIAAGQIPALSPEALQSLGWLFHWSNAETAPPPKRNHGRHRH